MYMMYLSVFKFFICISEMDKRCEKKSLVRENFLWTVHQEKCKMCWYLSN